MCNINHVITKQSLLIITCVVNSCYNQYYILLLQSPDNLKKDADIMTESTTSEELEFEKNLAKLKKEPDVDTTMETLPVKDKEEAMDIDVESGNEMTTRRSKRLRQKDNEDEYLEKKIKHELPDKSSNEEEKNEQTDNTGPGMSDIECTCVFIYMTLYTYGYYIIVYYCDLFVGFPVTISNTTVITALSLCSI